MAEKAAREEVQRLRKELEELRKNRPVKYELF